MKVSIALTLLNEGSGMAEVLGCLPALSSFDDEIVVVGGGSRDGTINILEDFACRDPRIKVYVELGVNIACGRNLAIVRAQNRDHRRDGRRLPARRLLAQGVTRTSHGIPAGSRRLPFRANSSYVPRLAAIPNDCAPPRTRCSR